MAARCLWTLSEGQNTNSLVVSLITNILQLPFEVHAFLVVQGRGFPRVHNTSFSLCTSLREVRCNLRDSLCISEVGCRTRKEINTLELEVVSTSALM